MTSLMLAYSSDIQRWRLSAPVQTGPGAHPASCRVGTMLLPRVKRLEPGLNHQMRSRAEVKERVELHLYWPSVPPWQIIGWILRLSFYNIYSDTGSICETLGIQKSPHLNLYSLI
jgi:hypothetical protein